MDIVPKKNIFSLGGVFLFLFLLLLYADTNLKLLRQVPFLRRGLASETKWRIEFSDILSETGDTEDCSGKLLGCHSETRSARLPGRRAPSVTPPKGIGGPLANRNTELQLSLLCL